MKNDTIIVITKNNRFKDFSLTRTFPINLITKVIKKRNRILDVNEVCRQYSYWRHYITTREATQKEQFLFYVNNEIPFVLKEVV